MVVGAGALCVADGAEVSRFGVATWAGVGSSWSGQDLSTRAMASRSGRVTHRPYAFLIATCRATYSQRNALFGGSQDAYVVRWSRVHC